MAHSSSSTGPVGVRGAQAAALPDESRAWAPEECIRQAEAAKEAGNALLRRGELVEAAAKYREGLELLRLYKKRATGRAWTRALQQRADAVLVALHLNLAQACLKQRDWPSAAQHADEVLAVDPDNMKALYRRAVARSHADSTLEQACADLERVLALDPGSAEARELLERTEERLRTFYDVLGVPGEAAPSQVRQAYLREAKRWHPDKAEPADKELADRRFKQIAEAHEVLRDAQLRQHYDLYLQWRRIGYVEFEDPDNPATGTVRVPFKDWPDFRRLVHQGGGSPGEDGDCGCGAEGGGRDEDDAPLSIFEWLLGGGVLLAVWCYSVWRHNRRQWLKALPADIWDMHEEYSIPLGLLMSPFFFGNVPFEDTVRWIKAMVGDTLLQ